MIDSTRHHSPPSSSPRHQEHRVHKVEMRAKENGEQEDELVVSNLRPFTLKVRGSPWGQRQRAREGGVRLCAPAVTRLPSETPQVGVHDALDMPILDCALPLRASLLYENGLPVKQTSSSEPLLVGETDVVALQGAATFKLRITSLSSHRDKQRFRIQVAPQDPDVTHREPLLCVVTDPMKSVTKLGRASTAASTPLAPPPPMDPTNGYETLKRKCAAAAVAAAFLPAAPTPTVRAHHSHTVAVCAQVQGHARGAPAANPPDAGDAAAHPAGAAPRHRLAALPGRQHMSRRTQTRAQSHTVTHRTSPADRPRRRSTPQYLFWWGASPIAL